MGIEEVFANKDIIALEAIGHSLGINKHVVGNIIKREEVRITLDYINDKYGELDMAFKVSEWKKNVQEDIEKLENLFYKHIANQNEYIYLFCKVYSKVTGEYVLEHNWALKKLKQNDRFLPSLKNNITVNIMYNVMDALLDNLGVSNVITFYKTKGHEDSVTRGITEEILKNGYLHNRYYKHQGVKNGNKQSK